MRILYLLLFLIFLNIGCNVKLCDSPPNRRVVHVGSCSQSEHSRCRVVLDNGDKVTVDAPIDDDDIERPRNLIGEWMGWQPRHRERDNE